MVNFSCTKRGPYKQAPLYKHFKTTDPLKGLDT